ncbi:hypothetical protein Rhopal_002984-T1 [Rhodotorula paludigena]|uniref:Uncharacterized protein n=1 Tax=Rhodotorula paludigena TaxID=86838 RepID=A0AAV5GJG7_9BASI|nr:hypothetical protein Rhopal_002984-T1 [Rhodotorula paludigena]
MPLLTVDFGACSILTPSTHGNALRKAWQKSSKRVAFTTREQDLPQQHKLLLGKSVTQHRLLTQPKKQLTRTLLAIFIELSLFTLDDFESTIPKLDRNLADTHVKICLFFALWSHYALRNNLDAAYTWLGFLCASSALQVFVHGNQRLKPFNLDSQEPENDISPHIGRFACDQGLSKEETQAIVTQIGCRLGKNRKKANNNKTWRFVQDLHY